MHCLDLIERLAGPLATLVAAFAAFYVTWRLGKSQIAIAKAQKAIAASQRDIAYDRLKYDLFEKRYSVYSTARKLLKFVLNNSRSFADTAEFVQLRTTLAEAHFFFGEEQLKIFRRIIELTGELAEVRAIMNAADEPNQIEAVKRYPEIIKELVTLHSDLPHLMKSALGFSQMTLSTPSLSDTGA